MDYKRSKVLAPPTLNVVARVTLLDTSNPMWYNNTTNMAALWWRLRSTRGQGASGCGLAGRRMPANRGKIDAPPKFKYRYRDRLFPRGGVA
jgi:hypothetical protein